MHCAVWRSLRSYLLSIPIETESGHNLRSHVLRARDGAANYDGSSTEPASCTSEPHVGNRVSGSSVRHSQFISGSGLHGRPIMAAI